MRRCTQLARGGAGAAQGARAALAPRLARGLPLSRVASAASAAAAPARGFAGAVATPAAPPSELTAEDALQASKRMLSQFERGVPGMTLAQTFAAGGPMAEQPLPEKWKAMMTIYLQTQLQEAVPLGFTMDQEGLQGFNAQMARLMMDSTDGPALQAASRGIWKVVLQKAFDVEYEPMALSAAREFISKVSAYMQSEEFLEEIDEQMKRLGADVTDEGKHSTLLESIMLAQMTVMQEFDFAGEAGYVTLQAGLMEHATDVQIQYNTMAMTMAVFQRAGLQLSAPS